ncbi:MAG: DUF4012 domain-containing protein [Actinobacteria bacterium]|nr:DUF4012 domain-containing protein [Actinomycetota bacterium]
MKVPLDRVARATLVVLRIWISSLVLSALSLGIAALLGGLNVNTIVAYLRDGEADRPATYPLKIAQPLWWLGANQPGVQLLRIVPGVNWIPESLSAVSASWGSVIKVSDAALSLSEVADRGVLEADGTFNTQTVALLAERANEMRTPFQRLRGLVEFAEKARGPFWKMPEHAKMLQQLRDAHRAGTSGIDALSIAESLLLSEKPRTIFVGITNPAETRGLHGIIGQFAIVELGLDGIHVREVDSNLALRDPRTIPNGLSAGYVEFYGDNNPEWQNMTLSPFVDDAAEQISAAWRQARNEDLDAVVLVDTVALARLATARGNTYMSAQGRLLSSSQALSDYLSNGLYVEFPIDNLQRKKFQTDLGRLMIDSLLLNTNEVKPLVNPLSKSMLEGRIALWVGHSLSSTVTPKVVVGLDSEQLDENQVILRLNNFSGNKMDFYLQPWLAIEQCGNETTLTLRLVNIAPRREELPDYVLRRLDPIGENPASFVGISLTLGRAWQIAQWSEDNLDIDPTFIEEVWGQRLRVWAEVPIGEERSAEITLSGPGTQWVQPDLGLAPLASPWTVVYQRCRGG